MIPQVATVSTQLRSEDPLTRYEGARALRDLVHAHELDALPALLASLDAVELGFPFDLRTPDGNELPSYRWVQALHDGWASAATGDTETADAWYTALLERAETADPDSAIELLRVLASDWRTGADAGLVHERLLAAHAPRVVALFRRLAEQGTGIKGYVAAVRQTIVRRPNPHDPVLTELSTLAPTLSRADVLSLDPDDWTELVLERHPDPPAGLAALLGALPTGLDLDEDEEIDNTTHLRGMLRGDFYVMTDNERRGELSALAELLRPHAERWTDDELDIFVRFLMFDDGPSDDDLAIPELAVALRRAPNTRAIPRMLLDLGRSTTALTELASVLQKACEPRAPSDTEPTQAGVAFTDQNFKLIVIDHLMNQQQVLDLGSAFSARYFDEYDIGDPTEQTRAARNHFAALVLTPEHLAQVTDLYIDASLQIWEEVDPGWGGEHDEFYPVTYVDVTHLPNLRTIEIEDMYDEDTDFSALHERDLEVVIHD